MKFFSSLWWLSANHLQPQQYDMSPEFIAYKKKIGQFMELTARYLSGCFIDALNIKFWKKIKQHGFVSSKLSQYIQLVVQAVVWDFLINGVLD